MRLLRHHDADAADREQRHRTEVDVAPARRPRRRCESCRRRVARPGTWLERRHALGAGPAAERDLDLRALARRVRGCRGLGIAQEAEHRALRVVAHQRLEQACRIARAAAARIVLRIARSPPDAWRVRAMRIASRNALFRSQHRRGEVRLLRLDLARACSSAARSAASCVHACTITAGPHQ